MSSSFYPAVLSTSYSVVLIANGNHSSRPFLICRYFSYTMAPHHTKLSLQSARPCGPYCVPNSLLRVLGHEEPFKIIVYGVCTFDIFKHNKQPSKGNIYFYINGFHTARQETYPYRVGSIPFGNKIPRRLSVGAGRTPLKNNILSNCTTPLKAVLIGSVSIYIFLTHSTNVVEHSHHKSRFSYCSFLNSIATTSIYDNVPSTIKSLGYILIFCLDILSNVSRHWQGGGLQSPFIHHYWVYFSPNSIPQKLAPTFTLVTISSYSLRTKSVEMSFDTSGHCMTFRPYQAPCGLKFFQYFKERIV